MILKWKLFESHGDIIEDCRDILRELNYDYRNFQTEVKIVNANSRTGVEMWKTMYWKNKGITNDFLSIDIKKIEQVSAATYTIRSFEWGEIKDVVFRIADYIGVDYNDVTVSYATIGGYGDSTLDELEKTSDSTLMSSFSMEIKL